MSNVEKFPNKGVFRDDEGNATGFYQGYSKEEAEKERDRGFLAIQALPLADDKAKSLGFESIFEVPEEQRFQLIDEAISQLSQKGED